MGTRFWASLFVSVLLTWTTAYSVPAFLVYFPTIYIIFGGLKVLRKFNKTFWRDIDYAFKIVKVRKIASEDLKKNKTYHEKWQSLVAINPNKVAIVFQNERWTYYDIVSLANKVANYLSTSTDLEVGVSVALIAENCPEFIVVLLALSKLGCPAALINFNLVGKQLIHSIQIASCKAVIVSNSLSDKVKQVEGGLSSKYYYSLCRGETATTYKDLIHLCQESPNTEPAGRNDKITFRSTLCYIYTSGTTGLPKACVIPHFKAITAGFLFGNCMGVVADDVLYVTLPLYHSSALLISISMMVHSGCRVYLKSKFSASQFWDDCVANDCTVVFYIGELCRYLLLQPTRSSDTSHKVIKAIGNGLRPSLWNEFKERFKIKYIYEFYSSTEGYSYCLNFVSEPGYVGYVPISLRNIPFLGHIYNMNFLSKLDPETGEPIRSRDGLCVRCETNEPGEILGLIREGPKKMLGYLSVEATKKKVIRNVVAQGDTYLRTGDVMSCNELGFLTFLDRKGENVSTSEVESIITSIIGHDDVILYSVAIPGTEGRAGMAAIVKIEMDLDTLLANFRKCLPSYSVPLFIRMIPAPELTSTYKYRKVNYKEEGFDINALTDPIFFLDPRCSKYVPLNSDLFSLIMQSKLRI